ncbi:MAG: glycosyl hydrolase [Bryobacteraceae bacterium]
MKLHYALLACGMVAAQTVPDFSSLTFRSLGPAVSSGRVTSFAVNPSNPAHYFVGVGSGGVWKTTNAGTTYTPVFDGQGSYSIGTVALDPRNPSTVWVGSGENNSQRSVSWGDGVYRSDDGGKTWRNLGLKSSEHISRIAIDPRDSNVVYVAAQGPLWSAGGERGLYKTTDGGKTFSRILETSENTGVTDVALDPVNPDVLLAASWQRRRHVWTLINGGPESAIHKSTDAGKTWRKVSSGLPGEELGRIGFVYSPAKLGLVYAKVEAANKAGGVFRSLDGGESWEKRNGFDELGLYYGQIIADPKNPERIFVPATFMQVSYDGGKTLRALGDRAKHVDSHTLWVDPANTDHMLIGCDGGIYESWDSAETWQFKANLPVAQFYDVTVDNAAPFYNVCGGTQDNATLCGPSRTRNAHGIANSDWFVTVFGDGFQSRVDPDDPNTIYSESQYGGLVRYDKRTGERIGIQPAEGKGEPPLRWNWDSPLILSPHSSRRLYFGANKVFRSDDRGDSWRAISPDVTRALDRDKLPVMGRVWGPDAVAKNNSSSFYSNLTALAESPKQEGLLYSGSDDGLIHVTENAGGAWRKVETFPDVPDRTYVSRLVASQHDAAVVYAAFDNHKNGDYKPYLLRSADRGATWNSIVGDLPKGPVLAIAEDHVNRDLLFAGTEYGLFVTLDGGKKWHALKGGMPMISVRDLAIQKRENDLVAATFGRGFYVLDDYSPLRALTPDALEKEALLFPVRNALEYVEARPYGNRGKPWQGESFYTAPNPPFGATFTYWLKDGYKTAKQRRQDAQKEADKKKESAPYPSIAELSREAEEEAPSMILTVTDAAGKTVRRLNGPVGKGFQRVTWDLRYPAPGEDAAGGFVPPGRYTVAIAKRVNGVTAALAEPQSFEVRAESSTLPQLIEFQKRLSRIDDAVDGAIALAGDTEKKLDAIRRALQSSVAPPKLLDDTAALSARVRAILRTLRGDLVLRGRQEAQPPSIADRVGQVIAELRNTTSAPTRTHQANVQAAEAEFAGELAKLKTLVETDLKKLERDLDANGVPYTPGRIPALR